MNDFLFLYGTLFRIFFDVKPCLDPIIIGGIFILSWAVNQIIGNAGLGFSSIFYRSAVFFGHPPRVQNRDKSTMKMRVIVIARLPRIRTQNSNSELEPWIDLINNFSNSLSFIFRLDWWSCFQCWNP